MSHCKDCIHDKVCDMCAVESGIPFVNADICKHFKDKSFVLDFPFKVGDKVAVKALCECVFTVPDNDECRYICPFEDDCEFDDCDNANERIFDTEISSIFNNGHGWKILFKNLISIEADITDFGISFFYR